MMPSPDGPRVDVVTLWTALCILLFAIPQKLVIAPLGGVGQPALLLCLCAVVLWLAGRILPDMRMYLGSQPVRVALLVHLGYMILGYAIAMTRPLTPLETTSSTRAVIVLVSLTGVALLAADGIDQRARLDRLVLVYVWSAAGFAAVGIVQFLGFDLVPYIRVPGLQVFTQFEVIPTRSIFNRPYGTANHPIEFGVVAAVALPLALHVALHPERPRSMLMRWMPVGLIAVAGPISLSRSAIVALAVAYVVLFLGWSWRERLNGLVWGFAFTVGMWAAVPGLVGTLRNLFVNAQSDPSITARIERVPRVQALIREAPWLGRGYGTYTPEDYFLLDNQLFETAIESGYVGVAVVVALLLTAVLTAQLIRSRSSDAATRNLTQALTASLCGLTIAIYTFDAFFYRIFQTSMFLFIGVIGALWRQQWLSRESSVLHPQGHSGKPSSPDRTGRQRSR